MLKNAQKLFDRCTNSDDVFDPGDFESTHAHRIADIAINLQYGNKSPDRLEVRELSGGYYGETRLMSHVQGGELSGFTWNKRYIVFYDRFFVLMQLKDWDYWETNGGRERDFLADYIFLPDKEHFMWERRSKNQIYLKNRTREILIDAKTLENCEILLKHICALKMNFLSQWQTRMSPGENEAFAPVRTNVAAKWYICGDGYMSDMADAIENAKKRILITDWQISPMIYLKRNYDGAHSVRSTEMGDYWRLDKILQRAANRGVHVYILVYQNPNGLSLYNYEATKYLRKYNRPIQHGNGLMHANEPCGREDCRWRKCANIFTLTHPVLDGPAKWSHHEKLVVVDDEISFLGGLDLSIGRWDVHGRYYMFDEDEEVFKGYDYWSQFNAKEHQNLIRTVPFQDGIQVVNDPSKVSFLDRSREIRTPWHDIACRLVGDATYDVASHFIERWNMTIQSSYKAATKLNIPVLRKLRVANPFEKMTKQILVPQIGGLKRGSNNDFRGPLAGAPPGHVEEENTVTCQIIRSLGTWSGGLQEKENSIYKTYLDIIDNAERFIFIENQFFVTTSSEKSIPGEPLNKIGLHLAKRILKAYWDNQQFKVYIVIPSVPGSGGQLEENTAPGQEVLLHITYDSICRGTHSIMHYLRTNAKDIKIDDYIFVSSYRTHEMNSKGELHQAIVYPHSKLIIVDDRFTVMGSANINDRSLCGDRDSEIGVIIDDYKFAISLRLRLWSVALGESEESLNGSRPESNEFFRYWIDIARHNFQLFSDVFCVLPNDHVFALPGPMENETPEYMLWKEHYDSRVAITNPEEGARMMSNRKGFLVTFPLDFLKDEDRVDEISDFFTNPSAAFTKEGVTQYLCEQMFH